MITVQNAKQHFRNSKVGLHLPLKYLTQIIVSLYLSQKDPNVPSLQHSIQVIKAIYFNLLGYPLLSPKIFEAVITFRYDPTTMLISLHSVILILEVLL
jgi:hypothetical protein